MANGNLKKGGGGGRDMVLESRHLFGLFLGVVVLCGVFFTLGYVMGRTQYDSSVRAASGKEKVPPPPAPQQQTSSAPAVPAPSEWDFYRAAEPKKEEPRLEVPAKASESAAKPSATQPPMKSAGQRARFKAPLIPRGAIVLQVAALTREGDALALAEALQQKEFPAFVLTPSSDNLYRVQVGPFADIQSANLAKRSLEREGFKTIAKR